MLLTETFAVALSSLRANKLRSLLTMLGIVIGVGAVISVIALGNGAENAVKDRIARLGTTTLQINPQRVNQGGIATQQIAKLTMDDVKAIEERVMNVAAVTPQQDRNLQVVWGNKNINVQVTGTTPNFLDVRGFQMAAGRMFNVAEGRGRKKYAVLGSEAAKNLDVSDPAVLLGEKIRIAGQQFEIIGVMAEKGATGFGDGDNQVLVPFEVGRFGLFGTDRINDIWAKAADQDSVTVAMSDIARVLRRSHRLANGRPDDFRIQNQSDVLETLGEATRTFSVLLAGIATVSLLVGGIGIMNIMLVSVTERTREIGVRKALGATRRTILIQFIIEAVVLCLVGGVIGIAAGMGGAYLLQQSFGWTTSVDWSAIVLSFAFSAAVGLIFGVWPARRAAVLDPIVALRYE